MVKIHTIFQDQRQDALIRRNLAADPRKKAAEICKMAVKHGLTVSQDIIRRLLHAVGLCAWISEKKKISSGH